MPSNSAMHRALQAVSLILVLGAAAAIALPAQAAPGDPHFNFRIQIPGGPSVEMGNGRDRGPRPGPRSDRYCLSDREMWRQLRDYGYFNIGDFRDLPRNRAEVEASYDRWVYVLRVDKCSGRIDQRRLRPIGPLPPPRGPRVPHNSGGFGLQFNF